eukprot:259446_1
MSQSTIVQNIEHLKFVVSKIGLTFKAVDDRNSATKDDIVYFLHVNDNFECLYGSNAPTADGLLMYKGQQLPVIFGHLPSIPTVTKHLTYDPTKKTCEICFEPTSYGCSGTCLMCHSRTCLVCMMKTTLTQRNIALLYSAKNILKYKCPVCRSGGGIDIFVVYYKVWDHLNEFTQQQKDALKFVKWNLSDQHNDLIKDWKDYRSLNKGSGVLLHGLKNDKWNGKQAIIIGDVIIKNNVRRWPIQLKEQPSETASIKEANILKVS